MARDLTLRNFLKDLGMRIAAAAVVLGIFFGLGYLNGTDFLSLSGSQFFAIAFLLVGIASLGWIGIQRHRD
ncbi:hypothetical protein DVR14_21260 (plasmid) [Natrinema thermotolerans]|nr:hypothetical protein DVR14_17130 [Natrinema thermotolerans]QCC61173.1 hypothetical protein DVR14_21260 [Natrinema thermotolerans]